MEMEGLVLANYRLVRKLGEGGMGAVYEAVHEQIGRRSAIKLLHAEFSQNAQICGRFFNEARAVNIVQHPGVVQVFEVGQLPDHTAYMVMEYLEGETLSARIKRTAGPMGAEALRITRQIASALAAAHVKGVVHRDLKPDNIMLVPDAETQGGERAKLLDFGIAKMLEDQPDQEMKTRTGMLLGTPTYMSPEQCRGTGGITEKTDVYSLGLMLYVMLCGRLPYKGGGAGEVIAQHLFVPPRSLKEYLPTVSDGLNALVHRMMAKKAEERPTMAEVTQALELLGAPRATTMSMQVPTAAQIAQVVAQQSAQQQAAAPRDPTTLEGAAGQVGKPPGTSQPGVSSVVVSTMVLGPAPVATGSTGSPSRPAPLLPSLSEQATQLGLAGRPLTGSPAARSQLLGPAAARSSLGAGASQIRAPLPLTTSGPQSAAGRSAIVAASSNPVAQASSPSGPATSGPVRPVAPVGKPKLVQILQVAGAVLAVAGGISYAVGVFGGSGSSETGRDPGTPRRTTAASKLGPKIRWVIRSNPPGAKLVRLVDGEVMGTTPYSAELIKGTGIVDVELQLEGYQSKRLVLDRGANTNVEHNLDVTP